MSRRYLLALFAVVLIASSAASALQTPVNLTGTWNGFMMDANDPNDRDAAVLILKQTGEELTGSGGPNAERQFPIQKGGKVTTTKDGTSAKFAVASDEFTIHFDVRLVKGRLVGDLKAEKGTEQRVGKADFERAK